MKYAWRGARVFNVLKEEEANLAAFLTACLPASTAYARSRGLEDQYRRNAHLNHHPEFLLIQDRWGSLLFCWILQLPYKWKVFFKSNKILFVWKLNKVIGGLGKCEGKYHFARHKKWWGPNPPNVSSSALKSAYSPFSGPFYQAPSKTLRSTSVRLVCHKSS